LRAAASIAVLVAACRIGEHHASPPVDGRGSGAVPDAVIDASSDAPDTFHGMRVSVGDRPEWTGSCTMNVPDYSTMMSHFASPKQQQDEIAGWEFDTDADSYSDPSYGFAPPWPMAAPSERFSLRYRATIELAAGPHCFSIDTGATGTDIITGNNECGQIWLGAVGAPAKLAEVGYQAASNGPATACMDQPTAGAAEIDLVFWYFNVLATAKLVVRQCDGASCTPDQPLSVPALAPL
jgi:hypothetical protein